MVLAAVAVPNVYEAKILFAKKVTSPDPAVPRHRSDASMPSECSELRPGFPFSMALLPGCGPWK